VRLSLAPGKTSADEEKTELLGKEKAVNEALV
jgi:hypothetical protein